MTPTCSPASSPARHTTTLETSSPSQTTQRIMLLPSPASSPLRIASISRNTLRTPPKTPNHNSWLAHIEGNSASKNLMFTTPSKASRPTSEGYIAFLNSIQRPDLIDSLFFLGNAIGSRFVVSGSTAMMLHAHRLGLQKELHRQPNDLDIRIALGALPTLNGALLDDNKPAADIKTSTLNQMNNDKTSHSFLLKAKPNVYQELKIDVLSQPCFGGMENPVSYHGIQLMPLATLIEAKEKSLEVLRSEQSALKKQDSTLCPQFTDNIAIATQDIEFLTQMAKKENESMGSSLQIPSHNQNQDLDPNVDSDTNPKRLRLDQMQVPLLNLDSDPNVAPNTNSNTIRLGLGKRSRPLQ